VGGDATRPFLCTTLWGYFYFPFFFLRANQLYSLVSALFFLIGVGFRFLLLGGGWWVFDLVLTTIVQIDAGFLWVSPSSSEFGRFVLFLLGDRCLRSIL
jgi:hypothetical protein